MNDGVHGWELFEGLRFILSLGNEDSSTEWEESTKQKRTGVFALYLLISIPPNFASEYQFGFVGNASFNSCKVNRFSRRERAPAFKRESVIFRVDSLEREAIAEAISLWLGVEASSRTQHVSRVRGNRSA